MNEITNHAQIAVGRLLQQYKGSVSRQALITALCGEIQVFEGALWSVYTLRWLGTAEGEQLDNFGEIVGLPRNGLDDATYAIWLQAWCLLNRSSGTIPEILAVFSLLTPGPLSIVEYFPACFVLRPGFTFVPQTLAQLLQVAKDGGVRALLEYPGSLSSPTNDFTLDGTSAQALDNGLWWGALE